MYDMSKIGTVMTWDEVVEEFPDRWVIMADCEYGRGYLIIKGTLVSVFEDIHYTEEMLKARDTYNGFERIIGRRTTAVFGQRW